MLSLRSAGTFFHAWISVFFCKISLFSFVKFLLGTFPVTSVLDTPSLKSLAINSYPNLCSWSKTLCIFNQIYWFVSLATPQGIKAFILQKQLVMKMTIYIHKTRPHKYQKLLLTITRVKVIWYSLPKQKEDPSNKCHYPGTKILREIYTWRPYVDRLQPTFNTHNREYGVVTRYRSITWSFTFWWSNIGSLFELFWEQINNSSIRVVFVLLRKLQLN